MIMKIAKHTVVTLDYTLKNSDGNILDTSVGREPLVYMHGVGALIPGLSPELGYLLTTVVVAGRVEVEKPRLPERELKDKTPPSKALKGSRRVVGIVAAVADNRLPQFATGLGVLDPKERASVPNDHSREVSRQQMTSGAAVGEVVMRRCTAATAARLLPSVAVRLGRAGMGGAYSRPPRDPSHRKSFQFSHLDIALLIDHQHV